MSALAYADAPLWEPMRARHKIRRFRRHRARPRKWAR